VVELWKGFFHYRRATGASTSILRKRQRRCLADMPPKPLSLKQQKVYLKTVGKSRCATNLSALKAVKESRWWLADVLNGYIVRAGSIREAEAVGRCRCATKSWESVVGYRKKVLPLQKCNKSVLCLKTVGANGIILRWVRLEVRGFPMQTWGAKI